MGEDAVGLNEWISQSISNIILIVILIITRHESEIS